MGFPVSPAIDSIYTIPQIAIYATPSDKVFTLKHKLQETHLLIQEYMDVEKER